MEMKRRVVTYFLSAASVYMTMGYITRIFIQMFSNFTFSII